MEKKAAPCIHDGDVEANVPIQSMTKELGPLTGNFYVSSPAVSISQTKKKKEKKNEKYRPWATLPDHITELIYARMDFIEKFSFASVCVSWREAGPEFSKRRPQQLIPWLLFSDETRTGEVSIFSPPEDMIHHVRIPQININFCRGSTEGWLFMFSDALDGHCFLLNPFTKATIHLPPFILKPVQFVVKVILSSNPKTDGDWIVAAQVASRELLFCKSGDESWFTGPAKSRLAFPFDDRDIIFSRGKVYALDLAKTVWEFDMKTQQHTFMGGGVSPLDDLSLDDYLASDEYISYLVESNGELFLVARFLKNTGNDCDASYHYITQKFLLYKLKKNDNENLGEDHLWVRQSSLGPDRALFVSRFGSKSVSIIESSGVQSNSIYFINDLHPQTGRLCDIGIYHVEDDYFVPFIPFDSFSCRFPSVWITPSIGEP